MSLMIYNFSNFTDKCYNKITKFTILLTTYSLFCCTKTLQKKEGGGWSTSLVYIKDLISEKTGKKEKFLSPTIVLISTAEITKIQEYLFAYLLFSQEYCKLKTPQNELFY